MYTQLIAALVAMVTWIISLRYMYLLSIKDEDHHLTLILMSILMVVCGWVMHFLLFSAISGLMVVLLTIRWLVLLKIKSLEEH